MGFVLYLCVALGFVVGFVTCAVLSGNRRA